MHKISNLLKIVFLLLMVTKVSFLNAQNLSNKSYTLSSYEILSENQDLNKDNCTFRDLIKDKDMFKLSMNNSLKLSFSQDEELIQTDYLLKDNVFTIFFTNQEGKVSYTEYDYSTNGNNSFTLHRKDPFAEETYTFSL